MDQQPYGEMVRSRDVTRNDGARFRKQVECLIRSLPSQPREQMTLHFQLITNGGLSFEGRLVRRHGDLHRLIVIQAEAKPSLRKLLQTTADTDHGFHDSELLLERLPPEVCARDAGRQPETHLSSFRFLGGRMS